MRLRIICFAACLFVTGFASGQEKEKPAAAIKHVSKANEPKLVVRFYALDELMGVARSFPYVGRIPGTSENSNFAGVGGGVSNGDGFTGGGGGLGGGGATGGGGLFNVPQGGGLGGGGLGGGGMSVGDDQSNRLIGSVEDPSYVVELLTRFVDPDSWKNNGGKGEIVTINQSLMVQATQETHGRVHEFLNGLTDSVVGGQPIQVDAWWLPLNSGERRKLDSILQVDWSNDKAAAQAVKDLAELTESSGGHHGFMRTRSGRTSHVTAGYRRPLVVSRQPVVGNGTSASQPIVTQVNFGIVLQVTPSLVSDWRKFDGDEKKASSKAGVSVDLSTSLTGVGPENVIEAKNEEVDRYDIGSQVLEASAAFPLGKPTVIGSLAAIGLPPEEGDDKNEIYVVLRVQK